MSLRLDAELKRRMDQIASAQRISPTAVATMAMLAGLDRVEHAMLALGSEKEVGK